MTENQEILTENVFSFIKSFSINKIKGLISDLQNIENNEDIPKLKKIISNIPSLSLQTIESFCMRLSSQFKRSYEVSKKVISKSVPEISKNIISPLACAVAIKSSLSTEDTMRETENNLRDVTYRLHKYSRFERSGPIILTIVGIFLLLFIGKKVVDQAKEHYIIYTAILAFLLVVTVQTVFREMVYSYF
jgi:hypothetical protein